MTCRRVRCATILCILVLGLLYPGAGAPEPTGAQGKIRGETHVNVRSGPDLSFPSVAVARQGELVTLEGEEKGWYRVALSDGTRGYVHETYIDPARIDPLVTQEEKGDLRPPSVERNRQTRKSYPSPSIRSMVQGEWGILQWVVSFLCVFGLGWILGGNYYLRRDRLKRHKLQL